MGRLRFLCSSLCLFLLCCTAARSAYAAGVTLTGTLSADNSVFDYTFTNPSTQTFDFYTTSYAGGLNADGTTTSAGGFVPVLTLFSNSSGMVLGFGGAGGICTGGINADPVTKLCDDANFMETLSPGAYTLALSEFPNVPTGTLSSPGFIGASDPTFTGDNCGVSGGHFLEADVAPCVQRTSSYALNVAPASSVVTPEPSTWLLVLSAAGFIPFKWRRRAA